MIKILVKIEFDSIRFEFRVGPIFPPASINFSKSLKQREIESYSHNTQRAPISTTCRDNVGFIVQVFE